MGDLKPAKNARARQLGQLCARRISFGFLGHCHFDFSVKIFFGATKNKVQFFSCRSWH
jgi:hypothetical protein